MKKIVANSRVIDDSTFEGQKYREGLLRAMEDVSKAISGGAACRLRSKSLTDPTKSVGKFQFAPGIQKAVIDPYKWPDRGSVVEITSRIEGYLAYDTWHVAMARGVVLDYNEDTGEVVIDIKEAGCHSNPHPVNFLEHGVSRVPEACFLSTPSAVAVLAAGPSGSKGTGTWNEEEARNLVGLPTNHQGGKFQYLDDFDCGGKRVFFIEKEMKISTSLPASIEADDSSNGFVRCVIPTDSPKAYSADFLLPPKFVIRKDERMFIRARISAQNGGVGNPTYLVVIGMREAGTEDVGVAVQLYPGGGGAWRDKDGNLIGPSMVPGEWFTLSVDSGLIDGASFDASALDGKDKEFYMEIVRSVSPGGTFTVDVDYVFVGGNIYG